MYRLRCVIKGAQCCRPCNDRRSFAPTAVPSGITLFFLDTQERTPHG